MREIRPSGSEGGGALPALPTPIPTWHAISISALHAFLRLLQIRPISRSLWWSLLKHPVGQIDSARLPVHATRPISCADPSAVPRSSSLKQGES
jgi:hypothetical protein